MRHAVKKIKLGRGRDATRSIIRKLALNFIQYEKIETTVTRAQVLRSYIDRIVYTAQREKKQAYRLLMRKLNNKVGVLKLIEVIAPRMHGRHFGFVTLIKIGQRLGDGAEIAKVQWVNGVKDKILKIKDKIEHESESDEVNKIS
ncbi:MAG TPA: 50S ribosomal protein L17 [Patescibacteria group bacterium]|nr:50S ribosomal protein L17 [Patescibacteria group bacterium]